MAVRLFTAGGLALGLLQGALAAENVEVQLLSGVCYDFAGSFQSGTGNSMAPDIQLKPAGTGTYLDTLEGGFGSFLETQRGTNPWSTLGIYNETGRARHRISCQDEDGLTVAGSTFRPIRINTDHDNILVFDGYGIMPEPYAHYVGGARQPGVFLGAAGATGWAWSNVTTQTGILLWRPRLLVATRNNPHGAELKAGEIGGFLAAAAR